MKFAWKILPLLIALFLLGVALRPSDQPVAAATIQRVPIGDTPVQAGISLEVRDLPSAEILPFVNKEINPRKNPHFMDVDMGQGGTWDRENVPTDPLIDFSRSNTSTSPDPNIVFDGSLGCNGCSPPDVTGAVGPDHYVSMVNVHFTIFNKDGTVAKDQVEFNSLFANSTITHPICSVSNDGDPIPIYDQMAQRWMLSQFAGQGPTGTICMAVSQTADPLGAYYLYEFQVGDFPDYFKFGAWPDGYYMSANEATYTAYVFDRNSMLTGDPATFQKFEGGTNLYLPSDMDGDNPPPADSPNYFYTYKDDDYANHGVSTDHIEIWEFHTDWDEPNNSIFVRTQIIPVASFTYTACGFFNFDCIYQKDTTQRVDGLGEWPLFRFAYRNFDDYAALVGTYGVGGGTGEAGASLRWFELRIVNGNWSLHQEGTQDLNDGHDRTNGSITMDRCGNIALGYTVSSSSIFPSIRYATRLASDPLGTLGTEVEMQAGSGSQTDSSRWGDYSTMVIDPTDDLTFWFTNEYYKTSSGSGWATSVGSFTVGQCAPEETEFSLTVRQPDVTICGEEDAFYYIDVERFNGFNESITLLADGNPGTESFSANPLPHPSFINASELTISDSPVGDYTFDIVGVSASVTKRTTVDLHVLELAPPPPVLLSPADGATGVGTLPTIQWSEVETASSHTYQIATDPLFTNIVEDGVFAGTEIRVQNILDKGVVYYWRVSSNSNCGQAYSEPFAFQVEETIDPICSVPTDGTIPDAGLLGDFTDSITINEGDVLSDLDMSLDVSHGYVGDLTFSLEHVDTGTTVVVMEPPLGGSCDGTDILATLDDAQLFPIHGQCKDTTPTIDGIFEPSNLLSAFNGETLSGEWQLTGSDEALFVEGTVNEWCLLPTVPQDADYSDAPISYGVAQHYGDGALRLGSLWSADQSFVNNGDDATDDGIQIQEITSVRAGALDITVTVSGTISGTNGWVKGWFDWDGNGSFDNDELAVNGAVTVGDNPFQITLPEEATGETNYRFRLFDSESEPVDGAVGSAENGEVEDGIHVLSNNGVPNVTIDDTSVDEDAGAAAVTVRLSNQIATAVTLSYTTYLSGTATAADLTTVTDSVVIPSMALTATIPISITNDNIDENDETFSVALTDVSANAVIFDDEANVTIVDDEAEPEIIITTLPFPRFQEDMGPALISMTLTRLSAKGVTVDFSTTDPSIGSNVAMANVDYIPISGTLTFASEEITKTVAIVLVDDEEVESEEVFNLVLSNPSNAAIDETSNPAAIVIADDDEEPEAAVSNLQVDEGVGFAPVVIRLLRTHDNDVTISYSTDGFGATVGDDFVDTDGTILFPAGTLTRTVNVPIVDDEIDESNETFHFSVTNENTSDNFTSRAEITITDNDDPPRLRILDTSVDESAGSVAVTITLSSPSTNPISVQYATSDGTATAGSDYTATSGNRGISAGQSLTVINIPILDDLDDENAETIFVTLSNPTNATIERGQATVHIIDNEAGDYELSIGDAEIDESGAAATVTVTLSSPAPNPISVDYVTSDGTALAAQDYTAIPTTTLTFAVGETSKLITVTVADDSLDEENEFMRVTLSNASGADNPTIADGQGFVNILDDDGPPTISIADVTVDEGVGTAVVTVTLSVTSGRRIDAGLSTSGVTAEPNDDYTSINVFFSINAGSTTATFNIPINDDNEAEENETFNATLSDVVNATVEKGVGVVTITDNEVPTAVGLQTFSSATPLHGWLPLVALLVVMTMFVLRRRDTV